jgi:hypothetical protein
VDLGLIGLIVMFVVVFTLPLILSSGAAYLAWRRVSRPWWYWVTATVALYGVYAVALYCLPPNGGISILGADARHPPSHVYPVLVLAAMIQKPLIIFTVVAFPALWGLTRMFRH